MPAATMRSADVLHRGGRRRDHADRDPLLADQRGEVVDVHDLEPPHPLADLGRVGVHQRGDAEPALGEPLVVGEGLPRFPIPAITIAQSCVSPSSRRIWWIR